jgi:plasmid maintenance system antidote protein VapI
MTMQVRKGDRFRALGCTMEVVRVSKTQTWADIVVTQTSGASWKKRQPMPFPEDWDRLPPHTPRAADAAQEIDLDYTIHPGVHWREIITESGHSQAYVAREMGISQKHLSQILGCHVMPGVHSTVKFSETMDVPVQLMWNLACNHSLALALGKKDLTADYL